MTNSRFFSSRLYDAFFSTTIPIFMIQLAIKYKVCNVIVQNVATYVVKYFTYLYFLFFLSKCLSKNILMSHDKISAAASHLLLLWK